MVVLGIITNVFLLDLSVLFSEMALLLKDVIDLILCGCYVILKTKLN